MAGLTYHTYQLFVAYSWAGLGTCWKSLEGALTQECRLKKDLCQDWGDGETEDQARKTISVTRNDRYMCFEGNQGGSAELGG